MQGIERIAPKTSFHALLIGCGPTGLMMAQFLYDFPIIRSKAWLICRHRKHSGVSRLTVAALEGSRMDLAKNLDVADFYVPLSRDEMIAAPQWAQIKKDNPLGFDIGSYISLKRGESRVNTKVVIEASGNSKVLENAIKYVRRGGKLICYGVYSPSAYVSWSPAQIFSNGMSPHLLEDVRQ